MLLVVLAWAEVGGMGEGLVWGCIGGLIVDLLSGGPVGATVLALLTVAFLAGQPWGRGIGSPVVRLLLMALVSVAVYHLVLLVVLAWTGYAVDWRWALLRVAGPSALFNALLAPFVHRPLAWLDRKMQGERFAL
jgi:rod shape-determining protein MreD